MEQNRAQPKPKTLALYPRSAQTFSTNEARRGFSLVELIVVMGVAMLLTSLILPSLRHVRENAHRVICMSHLQQMGQAFNMYTMKFNERLPYSAVLHQDQWPQDLMKAHRSGDSGGWDGLGLLFAYDFCPSPECFYCPSHHGEHGLERYADRWESPSGADQIYTNYHYAGDVDWVNRSHRRSLDEGVSLVLASDGLRTAQDFNHKTGLNMLRGDGSVRWRDNVAEIIDALPGANTIPGEEYEKLWDQLNEN